MSFDAITLALAKSYTDQHSGGGGGIQPNWNQNDETASDYIKNRPFFKNESYTLLKEEDVVLTNSVGTTWNINWQVGRIIISYDSINYDLYKEPFLLY